MIGWFGLGDGKRSSSSSVSCGGGGLGIAGETATGGIGLGGGMAVRCGEGWGKEKISGDLVRSHTKLANTKSEHIGQIFSSQNAIKCGTTKIQIDKKCDGEKQKSN